MEDNRFTSEISLRLMQLRIEHRSLDVEISTLQTGHAHPDQLLLQRLKKRKLWLKDTIVKLESLRIPDLEG